MKCNECQITRQKTDAKIGKYLFVDLVHNVEKIATRIATSMKIEMASKKGSPNFNKVIMLNVLASGNVEFAMVELAWVANLTRNSVPAFA